MKNVFIVLLITSGAMLAGCTSLKSTGLKGQDKTPPGLTYRLPAKQFTVKASYQVTECIDAGANAEIRAKVKAEVTESLIGAEAYTIDYRDLNTWTKVTNTEFQLSETGLLTGVNASIADQTGTVIQNTLVAAANIALGTATGSPALLMLRQQTAGLQGKNEWSADSIRKALEGTDSKMNFRLLKKIEALDDQRQPKNIRDRAAQKVVSEEEKPCAPVRALLTQLKTLEANLATGKAKDKKRGMLTAEIGQADLGISAFKDLAETYAKLGNDHDRQGLLKRIKLLEKEKLEAEAKLKVLGDSDTDKLSKEDVELRGKLSVSAQVDFVPSSMEKSREIAVNGADLEQLFDRRLESGSIVIPKVFVSIKALDLGCADPCDKDLTPAKIGIAYRVPVAALINVSCACGRVAGGLPLTVLAEKLTQVPQLGPIGSIDLNNQIFDDNLIELAFNGATGAPSKLTFRAKSKAEQASATARDAAGTYLQLQRDKRDDRLAANKSMLDQSTAEVALDKARSDLSLSRVQSSAAAATTQAQTQQALVSAQLQLLRDQQRLDAVRTGTATASEVSLEALNTQEQLLAQRLKILKLEQQITEQQAKAAAGSAP